MSLLFALASVAHAGKPATSLQIDVPDGGLCPGETFRVELATVDAAGRATRVKLTPKTPAELGWELGELTAKGELTMPLDPLATWGKAGGIVAEYAGMRATATIPVRYDCQLSIDLSGMGGAIGEPGNSSPPSPGQGINGEPGHPGGDGEDGPDVRLRMVKVVEPRTGEEVIQVEIQSSTREGSGLAAFSPDGGGLTVIARGGPGGPGGRGGNGGDGDQQSGSGGDGGSGGRGGRGGFVVFLVDPSAHGTEQLVTIDNAGGPGGIPGNGGLIGASAGKGGSSVNTAKSGRVGPTGSQGPAGPPPELHNADVGQLW